MGNLYNFYRQIAGGQGWSLGLDYYRMDGSTNASNRKAWSDSFNDPENTRYYQHDQGTSGDLGLITAKKNKNNKHNHLGILRPVYMCMVYQ